MKYLRQHNKKVKDNKIMTHIPVVPRQSHQFSCFPINLVFLASFGIMSDEDIISRIIILSILSIYSILSNSKLLKTEKIRSLRLYNIF